MTGALLARRLRQCRRTTSAALRSLWLVLFEPNSARTYHKLIDQSAQHMFRPQSVRSVANRKSVAMSPARAHFLRAQRVRFATRSPARRRQRAIIPVHSYLFIISQNKYFQGRVCPHRCSALGISILLSTLRTPLGRPRDAVGFCWCTVAGRGPNQRTREMHALRVVE